MEINVQICIVQFTLSFRNRWVIVGGFDSFNKILCSYPNKTSFPGPFYGTIILFLTEDSVWKEMYTFLWIFCAWFSDVITQGNRWCRRKMSAVSFLQFVHYKGWKGWGCRTPWYIIILCYFFSGHRGQQSRLCQFCSVLLTHWSRQKKIQTLLCAVYTMVSLSGEGSTVWEHKLSTEWNNGL